MQRLHALIFCTVSGFAAASLASPDPAQTLASAAQSQIGITLHYDPSYQRIPYPNGDIPLERGVCTDVVIRAYRKLGIDLQKLVHDDMRAHWNAYPHPAKWALKRPDTNIDHRRVPNLAVFFGRHGTTIAPSRDPRQFRPGDLVVWELPYRLPHIGIVADGTSAAGTPPSSTTSARAPGWKMSCSPSQSPAISAIQSELSRAQASNPTVLALS